MLCQGQLISSAGYTHLPTPGVGDRGKRKASGYSASLLGITELSSPIIPILPSFLVHTVKGLVLWLCHTRVSSRAKVWQVRVTGLVAAVEGNPVPPVSLKVLWSPVTGSTPDLRRRVSDAEIQESGLPHLLGPGATLSGRGLEIQFLHSVAVGTSACGMPQFPCPQSGTMAVLG